MSTASVPDSGHTVIPAETRLRPGKAPDFRLSFESAKTLFANLTPARRELLDTLGRLGPCTVATLAQAAASDIADTQSEVACLEFTWFA